jgi:hypothetical protein
MLPLKMAFVAVAITAESVFPGCYRVGALARRRSAGQAPPFAVFSLQKTAKTAAWG